MSNRKIYFGAGPAALPQSVLAEAAAAVLDYNNSGLSILEIPHRGKAFGEILEESKALVKELCGLDDDYEILWMQGGGRHQFAMIPMNFLGENDSAGYIDSGHWSAEAIEAAKYYGNVEILSSSRDDNYMHLPEWPKEKSDELSYLHFTTNNTIYGTQWPEVPASKVPLIADMSSDIFSVQRNYVNCSLFYAVVQKNVGPAGVTLVVVKKDMLLRIQRTLPDVFSYAGQAKANSLLNTPPVFAIYVSMLMLRWIKAKGMATIEAENLQKAERLYAAVDASSYFNAPVAKESRSLMNVVFTGKDKRIEQAFSAACKAANIEGIEGHRSVGGFRASLYNAVSLEDVDALVAVINGFYD